MNTNVKLSKEAIALVKEGMRAVVNEPRGTAYASRSAERQHQRKNRYRAVRHRRADHAWFIAYAPSDTPSVAMGILVEHALHGSTAAAPIAKDGCGGSA